MAPLIAPDYWMNCQLSIARYYGGCIIEHRYYFVHKESGYLVRSDFRLPIHNLGIETVKKALLRYNNTDKAHKVLSRLQKIIKARKRAEKAQDLELFENETR